MYISLHAPQIVHTSTHTHTHTIAHNGAYTDIIIIHNNSSVDRVLSVHALLSSDSGYCAGDS